MVEKIKKNKKKIIIIAIILVVVLVGIFIFMPKKSATAKQTEYTKLTKMQLTKSASASGNVESQNSRKVYSTSSNLVKEISVEIGDLVSQGQVLAILENKSKDSDAQQYRAAQNSLESIKLTLNSKKTAYDNNKILYDQGAVSKKELDSSEIDYKSTILSYERAMDTLDAAQTTMDRNISDSIIKAPINGTVTAVYLKLGATGSGLSFVVEDTTNLQVTTYIEEYDFSQVKEGQRVQIKSDATGDTVLNGKVVKISPAASKTTAGETDTSGSIKYETKIIISDKNDLMKIGMNARLTIIVDQKDSTYAVPYSAIKTNAQNKSVVYTIIEKDGKKIFSEVPVTKGIETDLYSEISGDKLSAGMIIISDPTTVKAGDVANINVGIPAASNGANANVDPKTGDNAGGAGASPAGATTRGQ